jgi:hypothetical protein
MPFMATTSSAFFRYFVAIALFASFGSWADAQNPSNLLVRYTFDNAGGTAAYDKTANALQLALKGNTGNVTMSGSALNLNDANTTDPGVAATAETGNLFNNLKTYTVTGWYNDQGSASTGGHLVSMGNPGNSASAMHIVLQSNQIYIQTNTGTSLVTSPAGSFPSTGWIFFAVTVDSTASSLASAVKIYEGTPTTTATALASTAGSGTAAGLALGTITNMGIGNTWNAVIGNAGNVNRSIQTANMADVRIYSGALSSTAVDQIRQSTGQNLLVRFPLDEGTGLTSSDATGNLADLTFNGDMAGGTPAGAAGWSALGGGIAGVDDYAANNPAVNLSDYSGATTSPGTVLNGLAAYTLTGWYNDQGSASDGGRLFSLGNSSNANSFLQLVLQNNQAYIQVNSGTNLVTSAAGTYPSTGWTYFAVTVNSAASTLASALTMYEGTKTTPATVLATTTGTGTAAGLALGTLTNLALGNSWTAVSGNAGGVNRSLQTVNLSDFRIYKGALAAADVEAGRQERGGNGPYPEAIAEWSDATKAAQRTAGTALLASIASQEASHPTVITVPPGDYRFNVATGGQPAHINWTNYSNVTINFQGSTLWFETEASAIALADSTGVTIGNVNLDWDPLPYIQGTVVAVNNSTSSFSLMLDPGYSRVLPGMAAGGSGGTWRGFVFNNPAGTFKTGQDGFDVSLNWSSRNADGSYEIGYAGFIHSLVSTSMAVGDKVVVLNRMGRSIRLDGSTNCSLLNVTLYSSPFIEFEQNTGSNPILTNCKAIPRPGTNRLMGGNADGFNFSNLTTGPTINGCTLVNIGDDAVNINGDPARVIWQNSPTQVVVSQMNDTGANSTPTTVKFYNRATGALLGSSMATWTINSSYPIVSGSCLANITGFPWHSGYAASLAFGTNAVVDIVTLSTPVTITVDAVATCEKFCSPNSVVENNTFTGCWGRGVRFQSLNTNIHNNAISTTAGNSVSLGCDWSYWGEGCAVSGVTVNANTLSFPNFATSQNSERAAFIAEQADLTQAPLISGVTVTNNNFNNIANQALVIRDTSTVTATGNTVSGYGLLPPYTYTTGTQPIGVGYGMVFDTITGLTQSSNTISGGGTYAVGTILTH